MKRTFSSLFFIITTVIILSFAVFSKTVKLNDLPQINGEVSRETENITLTDGTDTGVRFTKVTLSGYYGSKIACITEFKLSNTHLSVDVINHGKYMVSRSALKSVAESYSNDDRVVLSAINGDLWFTTVHSNTNVTTKVLGVPRGITVINGEIWTTQQFGMENYVATNAEKGTTTPDKNAFGVTYSSQPLVGSPVIVISVTNNTNGYKFTADGLNRLPAWNSVVVYNSRVNSSNYALNDSYEIEIETSNSHLTLENTVTGTVKAIYPSGSTTRPSIGDNTVILTSRGDKMADMVANFKVGNTVTISASITDKYGHTDLWQNVKNAVGGHMPVLYNGEQLYTFPSTEYPTTLIGYKNDGTVMFCTMTSTSNKVYKGLNEAQAAEFCKEIGYNSVFYLDGGGSTTSLVLKDGTYTYRNCFSDGSVRSVISSVAVVWNKNAVCSKQGTLSYIEVPIDYSEISPLYLDGALLKAIEKNLNKVTTSYDKDEKKYNITVTEQTNDPFVFIDYSKLKTVNAEDYPYLVLRIKSNMGNNTAFKVYYACGTSIYPSESTSVSFTLYDDVYDYTYYVLNMGSTAGWTGKLNSIRLDPFNSIVSNAGDGVQIDRIILCKNLTETLKAEDGWIPDGVITDFYEYLQSLKVPEEEEEEQEEEKEQPDPTFPNIENYYTDITGNTSVTEFKQNNGNVIITDSNGAVLSDSDLISTGCKISEYDSTFTNLLSEKQIVIKGDLDGNGKVTSVDALIALKASAGLIEINDCFRLAGDFDNSKRLTSKDALMVLKCSAGIN